ncbi:MAG TPA: glycosyltransferase [Oscillatoriales cyanobacterium M59_W2019_021]|nr:glycosyltransferase [Oscillatoriales cyanobacterium M4454_W2019_049]HIK50430.1 glycosyltransferase [Oscillatoriales cyanobacterium M59_W2019_021]
MKPFVSVIVPIYNGEADVPELLACLRSQVYPGDHVEYYLVDNNSGDRTTTLLEAAAQLGDIALFPLRETQIQSSYAARNTGIRSARGEILAFTDADCRPQPHWLLELVAPFTEANVGIVAGEIRALPPQTWLERHAERAETLSQKHTLNHSFCAYGQTANLAIRRDALQEVGLFRPYLTTGGDADLCWRILRQTHWQLRFAESAVVLHRHRATLRELSRQWRRYGESNRYLHQLHGVDLMPEMTAGEYAYRLLRWVFKECPRTAIAAVSGRATLTDIWGVPIDLFNTRSRAIGQRSAQLSPEARSIPPFETATGI